MSLALTSGVQVGPAKTLAPLTHNAKGSVATEADYSTRWLSFFASLGRRGLSWRMCQVSSRRTKALGLKQLSAALNTSGIWGDRLRLTLSTRADRKTETEYSLWQLLDPVVPTTSLLTAANCLGILRRANGNGHKLDKRFENSLKETIRLWFNVAEASGIPRQKASAPRYVPSWKASRRPFGPTNTLWRET
jgi:hypothetical protein